MKESKKVNKMTSEEREFGNYLKNVLGYQWEYEPKSYKKPPDFLVIRKDGKKILCEVKTLEIEEFRKSINSSAKRLKERLETVKAPFCYWIKSIQSKVPDEDLKEVALLVKSFFDQYANQYNKLKLPIEFIYSREGKQNAKEFVIIESDDKNPEISQMISIKNRNNFYPMDIHSVSSKRFKITDLDQNTKTKSGYEIKAHNKPAIKLEISSKYNDIGGLLLTGLSYGVHSIKHIKNIRNKIHAGYKKFSKLRKIPATFVIFSKRLHRLKIEEMLSIAYGDFQVNSLYPRQCFLGDNKLLQPTKNRNISAIIYFDPMQNFDSEKNKNQKIPRYTIIHNFWAKNPLDYSFFENGRNRQIFLRKDEYRCIGCCGKE